ncbi:hypothetical protein K7X08_020948 [Anisodus acutangulus]|uniref:BHLH domain-containing protein n=1 Tax=Anisodus acutangulus TaxID=402998 RepID=A0A9Q1MU65_9SOLA|nr:hypothetical protein K7X08_020948 [Anisodus acutangulus]
MALETLSSNEFLNFIIYDTLCSAPFNNNNLDENALLFDHHENNGYLLKSQDFGTHDQQYSTTAAASMPPETSSRSKEKNNLAVAAQGGGRKKRRRRPKICKNKEEAENQRMTHIAVERNRRKQMNEHLAVLRSLMPESYVQRGDQASIVGGAIEFVKELEHILQSLEAKKFLLLQQGGNGGGDGEVPNETTVREISASPAVATEYFPTPFAQFFSYPQYTCCQLPNKYTSKSKAAIADIEVTLIETHANVRILSRRRFRQLSKLVAAFQSLYLTVLHLNVTTLDPLVLYSICAKVEEGCQVNSADDIADAVHHMLRIIEEEAATLSCQA